MGLTGLPEMHVHVDEAGAGHEAAGVDPAGAFPRGGGERGDDPALVNKEVPGGVAAGRGIDHPGVLDPEGGHDVS
jgi:hypothetical protein